MFHTHGNGLASCMKLEFHYLISVFLILHFFMGVTYIFHQDELNKNNVFSYNLFYSTRLSTNVLNCFFPMNYII